MFLAENSVLLTVIQGRRETAASPWLTDEDSCSHTLVNLKGQRTQLGLYASPLLLKANGEAWSQITGIMKLFVKHKNLDESPRAMPTSGRTLEHVFIFVLFCFFGLFYQICLRSRNCMRPDLKKMLNKIDLQKSSGFFSFRIILLNHSIFVNTSRFK